ncbi:hypothetical protein DQG23_28370 [Paenibacillus contaminans]|uniref:histidine kinase n=2 Tax=Paenibacillus contaminans TaxID=450362 RepID=A0A329MAQ9_9BACL|nr:hypothetical protein DQG23_28370 [Paenibacillus contaminans]
MRSKIFTRFSLSAFIGIQIWIMYLMFSFPVLGINLQRDGNGNWVINELDTRNMAEPYLGLRIGDIITEINGLDTDDYKSVRQVRTIDQAEKIAYKRDGVTYEVTTENIPKISAIDLFALSGEAITLVIAFLLYRKTADSISARYLSLVFFNTAVIFISLCGSMRGDELARVLMGVSMQLLPIAFLHFLIIFFKEKGGIQLPVNNFKYLYLISALCFAIELNLYVPTEATYYIHKYITTLTMLIFISGITINLFILTSMFIKYRKVKSYLSTIIKTVWASLFVSFLPIAMFSFIPRIFYHMDLVDPFYMGWFILFFPITFAYLIMTKQLYDIDIVVRRIVFSVAIAIVPSLVITGIVKVLTLDDPKFTWERFLFFFIAATMIMAFSIYSFEYFTNKLMPVLFPRKHMLQNSIKQIARKLGFISSFREIKDIVLVDIVRTLDVYGGAVVFKYREMMEVISEGEIDTDTVERLVTADTLEHPDYTCFEIVRNDKYSCCLIMTKKRTGTLLGAEELQWLNMIISYLAVSLENVYLIRELMMKLQQMASQIQDEKVAKEFAWFRKLSFELQEKERQRIAADLHDSTLQDLFFLKRRLRTFMDKYGLTDEAVKQMNGFIEYIETINMTLRESCFELHPYLLKEIGLVRTIEKLIERESYTCKTALHFQAEQDEQIEELPMETKKHLFRIVQELITNAKKHAEADNVRIRLSASDKGLLLVYEDDGVGFDESQVKAKDVGSGGMGVEQIKSRIFHLNGRMKLQTSPGKGVRVRIELPAAGHSLESFESGA